MLKQIQTIFSTSISFPPKSAPHPPSKNQQQLNSQLQSNSVASSVQTPQTRIPRGFSQTRWKNNNWVHPENIPSDSKQPVRTLKAQPGINDTHELFSSLRNVIYLSNIVVRFSLNHIPGNVNLVLFNIV